MSPAALVTHLRDRATRLGPDSLISWDLLERAATIERMIWNGILPPSSSS